MPRGRPPSKVPMTKLRISIPVALKKRLDDRLKDPLYDAAPYGELSKYICGLIANSLRDDRPSTDANQTISNLSLED